MSRKKSRNQVPIQLYDLFKQLRLIEDGERELGLIISYTVVDSLLDFESPSGSIDERKQQQIKAVYEGLERAISECQEGDSASMIFSRRGTVDPKIQGYHDGSQRNVGESDLLVRIMGKLSTSYSRNPADRLKRDGIALYHEVISEGQKSRKVDALTGDYALVQRVMG
jgi:hypothetical protein